MGDTGSASSSGGSTSNLFADASLGDAISGGTGDLFGSGTPDMSSLFADAGLTSALLGDSSGLGGAFTTIDPSGTQAATQSITPQADVAGTPSGSDPSTNIGGTQSGGALQPNQPQTPPTPPATQQAQNESPLAQIAKALRTSFGLGQPPTAGGPTGPTPQQGPPQLEPPTIEGMPAAGDPSSLLPPGMAGRGRNFLGGIPGGIYNTMRATPAETGELPYGYGGSANQPARPYTPTPQPSGPMDPTILAGGPGAGAAQPPADPVNQPARPVTPTPDPPSADLPTKKGPQGPETPEAPPGPPQGDSGPTDAMGGIGSILRDVLGLTLANPTLLPMLAQMIGGRGGHGRGGIPPWAMHGMMPFMRGRGRGFGGFRGGMLRPGYYPRRQGGWGFHPGGYHPGWGSWAPGQRGNQPMAFAGGGMGGQDGGQDGGGPGAWAGANTQSGGAPDGGGTPGAGADQAWRGSGLASNGFLNSLVGQESGGGQNIVSRTDKDSHGLTLAQGGNPSEISQGYFQIQNHPGGTWQTYGRKAGIDLAKYPTPRSAPVDVQWKVASIIPISAWGHDTQVVLQRRGYRYNPNTPLGQVAAQYGGTQTQVAGGGAPSPSSSTSRGAPGTPRANIRIRDPANPIYDYPAPTETGGAPAVPSDDYATQG
jgi:hypothetical protein